MTLKQMSRIKRWLCMHGRQHPVEQQVWDLVLTFWLLGCVALPVVFLLQLEALLPLCALGGFAPALYGQARRRLHRQGRLRCDWLTAL